MKEIDLYEEVYELTKNSLLDYKIKEFHVGEIVLYDDFKDVYFHIKAETFRTNTNENITEEDIELIQKVQKELKK